jgi:carboxyl-terminal processing protease
LRFYGLASVAATPAVTFPCLVRALPVCSTVVKLHRAVVPLLILSLTACAGPSLPWQRADTSVDPIHSAYETLAGNYVDQPSPVLLLEAAYQGSRQVLADAGIRDNELQPPVWADGQAANWDRFLKAYSQITDKYGKQVGSDKLEYAAIGGMAGSLKDCQTHFYSPAALKERRGDGSGQQQFGGIGVLMKNIPGHPTVLRVLDGPARGSGLKPGDEIVAIDGKSVSGQTFEQVRNTIRGPQGSNVKVTVKRPGESDPRDFDVSRAQIQAPIVDAAILGNTVGYIHLYSFPQAIPQEIDNALRIFQERGVESVVFDVRANTGGDQQTILAVMSRFITAGTVEVQIERNGQRQSFDVDPSLYWKNPKPLVVLADEDTQAGGEIFAKAMQEEGGYRVIGAPTAGCAASARMYDLGDGSGLEVSVGKIVSGQGQDINRVGVKPDQAISYPVDDLAAGRDPQLVAALTAVRADAASQPSSPAPRPATGSGSQPSGAPTSNGAGDTPVLKPLTPRGGNAPIPILK